MAFESFFVHTATISRLQQGVGIQSNYVEVESSLPCLIEPVTAEFASVTDMVYGRTYNGYFRLPADVQIGDKIIDQDSKEYRVTGTSKRNYGANPHITVLMTEQSTGGGNDQ